jgi:16S rRNA (cytidine1402-2'-O)-methyltransferase
MGTLFVVATPIGNLEDMTLRAIRVLKEVDLIACEDTRVTRKLLDYYSIQTHTISYFQHSKLSKIDFIVNQLKSGKKIALVSDAGTPGISDPGQTLIRKIREIRNPKSEILNKFQNQNIKNNRTIEPLNNGIKIIPIPGPSALAAAASVSGMIEKEFYFAGFLPKKKGRQTEFKKLASLGIPIVIYESAMRIERTLNDIKTYFGENIEIFIAREMTKMFEDYWGGDINRVISSLKEHKMKGEIVVIIKSKIKNQNAK